MSAIPSPGPSDRVQPPGGAIPPNGEGVSVGRITPPQTEPLTSLRVGQKAQVEELKELEEITQKAIALYECLDNPEAELMEMGKTTLDALEGFNGAIQKILELPSLSSTTLAAVAQQHNIVADCTTIISFIVKQVIDEAKEVATIAHLTGQLEALQKKKGELQAAKKVETTQAALKILEPAIKQLQDHQVKLEKAIEVAIKEDTAEKVDKTVQTALALPTAASATYSVGKALGYMRDIAPISFGFTVVTSIAGIISSSIELAKAVQGRFLHKDYIKGFKPVKVDLTQDMTEAQKTIGGLIAKRKTTQEKRVVHELTDPAMIQRYETDPEFKKEILQKVEKKDTLSASAKSLLKARLLENEKINKTFFDWKQSKSEINVAVNLVLAVVAIALGALVLVGISIPLFPLMIPTILGVGLAAGLAIKGLIHLHKHRPALFAEIIRGTKIKMAFYQIPRLFHAWRLRKNQAALDSIKSEKQEEVNKVIKEHEEKLKHYEGKVNEFQLRLEQAREKDFEQMFKMEDFKTIVDGLVEGEFWHDEETVKLVAKQFGINPDELRTMKPEQIKTKLDEKVRNAIVRDSATLINWLKERQTP